MAEPKRPVVDPNGRDRLLALLAGQAVSGYTANPETSGEPPARIARWAVEIAKAVLAELESDDNAEDAT